MEHPKQRMISAVPIIQSLAITTAQIFWNCRVFYIQAHFAHLFYTIVVYPVFIRVTNNNLREAPENIAHSSPFTTTPAEVFNNENVHEPVHNCSHNFVQ